MSGSTVVRLALAGVLAASAVGAATVMPDVRLDPRSATVSDGPTSAGVKEAVVLCAGADRQGAADIAPMPQSVRISAVVPPEQAAEAGQGSTRLQAQAWPDGGAPETSDGAPVTLSVEDAHSVRVTASGALARGASALQVHAEGGGERRILAVGGCGPAVSETYLVAGDTQPGRQERLVLTNPYDSAATVDVRVLGADGTSQENPRHIVVPAKGRLVQLLDAVAPQAASPVVHVRVSGGAVHAALSDSWLEGVVPRGGDLAAPTMPGTDLVIPGIVRPENNAAVTLRLAAPGTDEAVVEVRAWTKEGQKGLKNGVTRVPAGGVVAVDVSDLPPGVSALSLHADVPVVAGVQTTVAGDPAAASDLAWTAAEEPVTRLGGTALPGSPGTLGEKGTATLALSAGEGTEVTVVQVSADGEAASSTVAVPQTGTVEVPVAGASAWIVPRGRGVHAALVLRAESGGPLLSVVPLRELPTRRNLSVVRPG